jgi:hypothetical protein
MRPRHISDWHFEQIICRNWLMTLIPESGGSATLSVTGKCLWRDAVMEQR